MSRHRDIRSMKYSDEYDGYDDVYGHSVEDDYCVSPGAEQFLYDRNKQQNIASFINEPDIKEDDEEIDDASALAKKSELSEIDTAKLMSCIEVVRNVIGDTIPDSVLTDKIILNNFNAEAALDDILKSTPPKQTDGVKAKDRGETQSAIGIKIKPTVQVTPSAVKVTPAKTRTVIKGFDLKSNTDSDYLSARQENPRSLSPNVSANNSPGLKRKDEGLNKNLNVSKAYSPRCQSPLSGRVTPEPEGKLKAGEDKRDVAAIYKDKRGDAKEQLHLVVVGHVDAGKSTLLGRLLCDLGQVSSKLIHKYQQESKKIGKQSFAYAWVLDETGEERERGITMDVGYTKFETETKSVTLLDAPGHKDFIPNMITGATQADVALLVVDATRGEFETGFDSGGQTREHALLLRSLGVSQIAVVVNKLDTVDWSKERFDEITEKMSVFLKQAGFRDTATFVPCSGLSGENLVSPPKADGLSSWYSGPTLLKVIDSFKCPERPITKPFRFSVNDVFKGTGSGFCISGHVEAGMVAVGDKVLLLPRSENGVVKGITADEMPLTNSFAGDHVSLILSGIDQQNIGVGDIICSPYKPIPVTTCFEAHVVIFSIAIPITKGLPVVLHSQSLVEPATITKLIEQLHKNTGQVIKKKPRCLPKNSSATIEISTQRPICLELYRDFKQLGRVMLRVSGTTIAAGLVTKIK
ncbi:protein HBS1 isoform X1 [Microplitis mediator]|uniref:protein HBS1 isoform X1 n=1 Tax=Microplitis mediator TaxID=375433 RepID=UPI002553AC61|nr:protein HBS1 isoform X1 [Microplitis mediator]